MSMIDHVRKQSFISGFGCCWAQDMVSSGPSLIRQAVLDDSFGEPGLKHVAAIFQLHVKFDTSIMATAQVIKNVEDILASGTDDFLPSFLD